MDQTNGRSWSNQKPLHRGSHTCLWLSQNQTTLKEDRGFIVWLDVWLTGVLGRADAPKELDANSRSRSYHLCATAYPGRGSEHEPVRSTIKSPRRAMIMRRGRHYVYPMKSRYNFASKILLILAFVCAISISTVAQGSPGFGRLTVERMPNFGWNLAFHLQIDGRSVATIVQGRRYGGWLPTGHHILTVYKVPYTGYAEPTSTTVDVQPGETYDFTAVWDSDLVYLRPPVTSSPGEIWQARGDL